MLFVTGLLLAHFVAGSTVPLDILYGVASGGSSSRPKLLQAFPVFETPDLFAPASLQQIFRDSLDSSDSVCEPRVRSLSTEPLQRLLRLSQPDDNDINHAVTGASLECVTHVVELESRRVPLSAHFRISVSSLLQVLTAAEFVDAFGTHFIAHAEFGSYVRVSINATRTIMSAWSVQGVDVVQAAADMARHYCNSSFNLSVDGELVASSVPAAQLNFTVWPVVPPGELLPCGQPTAWWQSIMVSEPAVLWGTISPISNLLSSFYFPNEPQLKRKRQAVADEVRSRAAVRGSPASKITYRVNTGPLSVPLFTLARHRFGDSDTLNAASSRLYLRPSLVPIVMIPSGLLVVYKSDDYDTLEPATLALLGEGDGTVLWRLPALASLHAAASDALSLKIFSGLISRLAPAHESMSVPFVYMVLSEHVVACVDTTTGNVQWRFDVGQAELSPLAVSSSMIVSISASGAANALHALTGDLLWSCTLWPTRSWTPFSSQALPQAPLLYSDVYAFPSALACFVHAMNAACVRADTGAVVWHRDLDAPVKLLQAYPAAGPQMVLLQLGRGLNCIAVVSGESLWSSPSNLNVVLGMVWHHTIVLLSLGPASLRAIDARNGAKLQDNPLPFVDAALNNTSSNFDKVQFPLVHTISETGIAFVVLAQHLLAINCSRSEVLYMEPLTGNGNIESMAIGTRGQLYLRTATSVFTVQSL